MSALQNQNNDNSTTFDLLEWYKRLTTCLAYKKNCKINLSRVPGGKEIKENKRLPSRITNQHLQKEFLVKYNEKRKQEEEIQQENIPKSNKLGFDLKQKKDQTANNAKRQKPDYINLPSTYFKTSNVPDLSIFKVPAARKEPTKASNNFTLETLFSGNFKPPRASTPFGDSSRPLISDPVDILNNIDCEVSALVLEKSNANLDQEKDSNLKKFLDIVDMTALNIDSTCFANLSDPLIEIINRLNNTLVVATQSPRASLCAEIPSSLSECRPIPLLYQLENEKNKTEIRSLFNKTSIDFGDFIFETPDRTSFPEIIDESILIARATQQATNNADENEFNWLDEDFNSMDFDEEEVESSIFRSPPTRESELKRKFSQATRRGVEERHHHHHHHNESFNSSIWSNENAFHGNNESVFDSTFNLL